ncbi:15669_t:CDS:2, partial [Rhizophagus irregularis]
MDIWDSLQNIRDNHDMQKHIQKLSRYQRDLSCRKCYGYLKDNKKELKEFLEFWRILKELIPQMGTYNWNTIINFSDLIPNEDEAIVEVKKRRKAISVIIYSIRYDERPEYTYKGIETIIEIIMENWVRIDDKGEVMVGINDIKEEIQTNKEVVEYGHRIGEKEIERRFNEFWEWYKTKTGVIEEVSYPKYKDGWKNNKLTEEIIEEFISSKQFEIGLSDVGSSEFNLVSSEMSEYSSEDDKETSGIGIAEIKERLERKGILIEKLKIERAIRLGYELNQILVVEFWIKYNELENLSDEKLKSELNEWVRMKVQENNEAIAKFGQIIANLGMAMSDSILWHLYNWRFDEKDIGNRQFLREYIGLMKMYLMINEKNQVIVGRLLKQFNEEGGRAETEEWLERAQENEIKVLESELLTLWNMGYTEEEVFTKGLIGKFQEIKDGLKTAVMKELDLWLARKRKKRELENESSEEEDEIDKIMISVCKTLLGTENELTKTDISRLLRLGFDQYEIVFDGLIREYKSVREKDDKEVHRVLYSHLISRGMSRNVNEEDTDESGSQRESEKENTRSEETQDENSFRKSETSSSEEEKSSDEALELARASEKGYDALKGKFKQKEPELVVKLKEVIKNQDKYDVDDLTRDFARLRASDEAKMIRLMEENRRLKGRNQVRQECTIANGEKIEALGKVRIIIRYEDELEIEKEVEVIDSSEDLILENDIWKKLNVSIDFENKEMRIERHEETIVIPISYEKSPEEFEDPESSSDEEEYESDNERTKHK